jgi:hypothetical protein
MPAMYAIEKGNERDHKAGQDFINDKKYNKGCKALDGLQHEITFTCDFSKLQLQLFI